MPETNLLAGVRQFPAPLLPSPVALEMGFHWCTRTRLGYRVRWLEELKPGTPAWQAAVPVLHPGYAQVKVFVEARCVVGYIRREDGSLRLQIRKASGPQPAGLPAFRVSVSVPPGTPREVDEMVTALLGVADAPELLNRALESFDSYCSVLGSWSEKLRQWLAAADTAEQFQRYCAGLREVLRFRDDLYRAAGEALEKKYAAELQFAWHSSLPGETLIDYDSGDGREQAAGEEQSCWLRGLEPRGGDRGYGDAQGGRLVQAIARNSWLDVTMPALPPRRQVSRLQALADMQVGAGPSGQVRVWRVRTGSESQQVEDCRSALQLAGCIAGAAGKEPPPCTVQFSDSRTLPAGACRALLEPLLAAYGFPDAPCGWLSDVAGRDAWAPVEAALGVEVPSPAMAAWFQAPPERSAEFARLIARVSIAVQKMLRVWLPYLYFSDVKRYRTPPAAYPMLAYQASKPFAGSHRRERSYDVLDPDSLQQALQRSQGALEDNLERVCRLLASLGMKDLIGFYRPSRADRILESVLTAPRLFRALLAADGHYIEELVKLTAQGRQVLLDMEAAPSRPPRSLVELAGGFVHAFHGRMKRLYVGLELPAFGALLLVEATSALAGQLGAGGEVSATLQLSETSTGRRQSFVNSAWRPRG